MNPQEKIAFAVVIPLYNKEAHIARALRSVLGQTTPVSEIVVVDDGSTDGSAARVLEFNDPRIKLICRRNGGVSAARNTGIDHCSSPFVGFLDADDEWRPDFLSEVASMIARFPAGGAYCTRYETFDGERTIAHPFAGVPETQGPIPEYFRAALAWEPLCSSSLVVRKHVLEEIGGFPTGVAMSEDLFAWREIAIRYPVCWSNKCAVVIHLEASNRTYGRLYTGHIPIDCDLGAHRNATAANYEEHPGLFAYEVKWRMTFIKKNWLIGDKKVVREMLRRSRGCREFRMLLLKWRLLACIPTAVVLLLWKFKQLAGGRSAAFPETAHIVPVKLAAPRKAA